MAKSILILIALIIALSAPLQNSGRPLPKPSQEKIASAQPSQASAIKVTITTVGSFLRPPTDHYQVGAQIPITITMTNTSTEMQSVCVSSDDYQDLPKLTKDGVLVPYAKWQSYELLNAARNHMCSEENLPETVLLIPNEPKLIDWFVLVDSSKLTEGAGWYDSLPPGKYELSLQRRFACCDGPLVESNKVSFEIAP
jgi:hypothetical protein